MENAIDRFLNVGLDTLIISDIFGDNKIIECVKIASDLKSLLALGKQDLLTTEQIISKNEKITVLKAILSKFDWQNSDLYERKEQTERDKLKHIFLTAYQLLAELDKVLLLGSVDIKGGKV